MLTCPQHRAKALKRGGEDKGMPDEWSATYNAMRLCVAGQPWDNQAVQREGARVEREPPPPHLSPRAAHRLRAPPRPSLPPYALPIASSANSQVSQRSISLPLLEGRDSKRIEPDANLMHSGRPYRQGQRRCQSDLHARHDIPRGMARPPPGLQHLPHGLSVENVRNATHRSAAAHRPNRHLLG